VFELAGASVAVVRPRVRARVRRLTSIFTVCMTLCLRLEFCVRWKLETGILTIEDVIYDFIHSWVWVHLRGRPGRVSSRRMFWHGSCISLCPEPGALRLKRNRPCSQKGGKTAEKIVTLPSPTSCITFYNHAMYTHTCTRMPRPVTQLYRTAVLSLARGTANLAMRPFHLPPKTNCDFKLLFCALANGADA
jgi:hypothetical protein